MPKGISAKVTKRNFIYFVCGELTRKIKIGKTNCMIEERIQQLQTGSPDKLVFLGAYYGEKYAENSLHRKFAAHRLHGEWFNPADEILGFINHNCITELHAFYHAQSKIDRGEMTYKEALGVGVLALREMAFQSIRDTIEEMYALPDEESGPVT